MVTQIDRERVRRLVERGAQLVDVLAVAEYDAESASSPSEGLESSIDVPRSSCTATTRCET